MTLLHGLDLLATFAFALVGARIAADRKMDVGGIAFIAMVASVSGGTVRNVFLGIRPIWLTDIWVISVVLLTVVITIAFRRVTKIGKTLLALDTLGLAVATISGTQLATQLHLRWFAIIVLGLITAVTGGLLRDVLCQLEPVLLHRETIGTSALIGACVFVGLQELGLHHNLPTIVGGLSVIVFRTLSIRYDWHLPKIIR